MPAQADEDDAVERGVGLAVAAAVEAVADRLARGGWDRGGAAEHREGGLGAKPVRVVAGGDQVDVCALRTLRLRVARSWVPVVRQQQGPALL